MNVIQSAQSQFRDQTKVSITQDENGELVIIFTAISEGFSYSFNQKHQLRVVHAIDRGSTSPGGHRQTNGIGYLFMAIAEPIECPNVGADLF